MKKVSPIIQCSIPNLIILLLQVAPLQALEVGKLRKRIGDFDKKQTEFRENFKTIRFFKFACRRPYHYLQMANDMIDRMEADMKTLQV